MAKQTFPSLSDLRLLQVCGLRDLLFSFFVKYDCFAEDLDFNVMDGGLGSSLAEPSSIIYKAAIQNQEHLMDVGTM